MKGLVIKKPWIDKILDGEKTWEIRSKNAKIRGEIALIQSGSGLVVGTCDLVDSILLSREEYQASQDKHRIPLEDEFEMPYLKTHAWVIQNPVRFEKPIPYVHPLGAVIWINLEDLQIA